MDAFSAAAEPNRRRILQLLATQPRTVTELAEQFPVTRSAISQHLLRRRANALARTRRDGITLTTPAGTPASCGRRDHRNAKNATVRNPPTPTTIGIAHAPEARPHILPKRTMSVDSRRRRLDLRS